MVVEPPLETVDRPLRLVVGISDVVPKLLVRQLLPRRGGIWSMWLDVDDNGFCRVTLTPRETKWNIPASMFVGNFWICVL